MLTTNPKFHSNRDWQIVTFVVSVAYGYDRVTSKMDLVCKYRGKTALKLSDTHNRGDPIIVSGKLRFEKFKVAGGREISRHYLDVEEWTYAHEPYRSGKKDTATREVEGDTDDIPGAEL